ncbi:hypothetical protein GCM10007852_21070 [Agaribacter marinus]|uniref:Uncharacterized protein n=1 Tax=Agaribacter marinus TaxID=1431249 RepID=A0AA37SZG9_9ALTE|nr:hypothetical protein GCM10007852_21070 [Agaribacter marinus]
MKYTRACSKVGDIGSVVYVAQHNNFCADIIDNMVIANKLGSTTLFVDANDN